MKKKILSLLLAVLLIVGMFPVGVGAYTGSGTESSPILMTTLTVGDKVSYGTVLKNDFDNQPYGSYVYYYAYQNDTSEMRSNAVDYNCFHTMDEAGEWTFMGRSGDNNASFNFYLHAGSAPVSTDYLDTDGTTKSADAFAVKSTSTELSAGWYVVKGTDPIEVADRITVTGDVKLILCDGAELDATAGITVESPNSLTVYGQANGTGKLVAAGNDNGARIGGSEGNAGGSITINGGTVTTTGGSSSNGAGIGGGSGGAGGSVTINGGTVNAASGCQGGAGIGGGYGGEGGSVTINGGTVTAGAGYKGAGIGGGTGAAGGSVTITGGDVSAYGGDGAAGIGGDFGGAGGTVNINGGTVTAVGGSYGPGNYGAGIGGGSGSSSHGSLNIASTMRVSAGNDETSATASANYATTRERFVKLTPPATAEVSYLDSYGTLQEDQTGIVVDSGITAWNAGWYIVKDTVTITDRITVTGDVKLILCDGAALTAEKGIGIGTNNLIIYGQTEGTGRLVADGGADKAGIGDNLDNGYVRLYGGDIEAKGYLGGIRCYDLGIYAGKVIAYSTDFVSAFPVSSLYINSKLIFKAGSSAQDAVVISNSGFGTQVYAEIAPDPWNALQKALAGNAVSLEGAFTATKDSTTGAVTITLLDDITCANQSLGALAVPAGKTVILDLNGFAIDRGLSEKTPVVDGEVFWVEGDLTITDNSSGETGKITGGNSDGTTVLSSYGYSAGGIVVAGGRLTLVKGSITGNKNAGVSAAGVSLNETAAFIMEGGSITGNEATYYVGGVNVEEDSSFTMTGGSISANIGTGDESVGGIRLTTGEITISGGEISENTGTYVGGIMAGDTFTMLGGSVINNVSTGKNLLDGIQAGMGIGGISTEAPLTLGGKAVISGNTADGKASNMPIMTMAGGLVSGGVTIAPQLYRFRLRLRL